MSSVVFQFVGILLRKHKIERNIQKMIPTEIITGALSTITAIAVCLINGHFERKKSKASEQERIQRILDEMTAKEQERLALDAERQAEYTKTIEEFRHSLEKMDIKLENMEDRIKERVDRLGKHVEKHNNFAERMPVVEEMIKVANNRIADLEDEVKEIRHGNKVG